MVRARDKPARLNPEIAIHAFAKIEGDEGDDKNPLFRSAKGKTGTLSRKAMAQPDVWRMIRKRAKQAGIKTKIGCHSFRATGITNYLENGGTLEKAQAMANHESPRTTKLYDRTRDQITLDEVERIAI
jgi:integrase